MEKKTEREKEERAAARARWRDVSRLGELLGHPVPLDAVLASAGPRIAIAGGRGSVPAAPCIDTFALERELEERHGPWEGSMADFIERRYGPEAVAAIERLLRGP